MDIVGYSKQPIDQQEKLLTQLQDAVRQTSEFSRAQAANELIRLPTGDGMALVFFQDAEAPVRCALELDRALRSQAALPLRMGIHTGPVHRVADINANENVAGGGINIAQRVMDCGDAGHILVSEEVAKLLNELSAWKGSLRDVGEIEVKHGLRIHLFNLFTQDAGTSRTPQKLSIAADRARTARTARRLKIALPISAILILGLVTSVWLYRARRAHALSEADTIILTDFSNKTGDTIFDDTLRQGLSVNLEQSPFLRVVSPARIQNTLRLMGQPADVHLTPELARDLCQRVGSKAYLSGSIANLGSEYVIGLDAVNCQTGDVLAQEQATAAGKEHVLKALDGAAARLRSRLGESLTTVQKLDTPLEQATTPSLEALQAYSLGVKASVGKGDFAASIPHFQRAIELDPTFAMAYAMLGINYFNLGESTSAITNMTKAFELRDRVSAREKFYISASYYSNVSGDLEKGVREYRLWAESYPREPAAFGNLTYFYCQMGRYDDALYSAQTALRLEPSGLSYDMLMAVYLSLNRFDEAKATAAEAQSHHLDSPLSHINLYLIAFVQNDPAGMAREAAIVSNRAGSEDVMLSYEALTSAYTGQFEQARELSRRTAASAQRAGNKEAASTHLADAALQEVLVGNLAQGEQGIRSALALSQGQDVNSTAAFVYAFAGDTARAEAIAKDLAKASPEDTVAQSVILPVVRALTTLAHGNAAMAVEILQATAPYELGTAAQMYPVYARGLAYLGARNGLAAAAEFQKILDHRGVVPNTPVGALAHLGLARAYALQGDAAKSRAAYQDFLTLWKDADPNIPILIAAKSELAKLH